MSWQVFRNPLTMFIGGVAAVGRTVQACRRLGLPDDYLYRGPGTR